MVVIHYDYILIIKVFCYLPFVGERTNCGRILSLKTASILLYYCMWFLCLVLYFIELLIGVSSVIDCTIFCFYTQDVEGDKYRKRSIGYV